MRTSFPTILLLLLAGVVRAALPTTQPVMATTDPVREDGVDFQSVAQAQWPVPAAGEKTEVRLGLKVTNRTEKVVQINLFDTIRIVLKDETGRSLPNLGGRDRTTYPNPLMLGSGESKTIVRNATLEWLKGGNRLRLIGQDGTGGIWYFDGLKPGKYTLSFEYENTEQVVRNLPNRPAPHAIDLKAGPYWYGKAKTKDVAVEIVKPDPIDRLVARLSSDPLWQNGISPVIRLPENASAEQVISEVFKMTGFGRGRVTKHRIAKVKQVHIRGSLPDQYTAALVETNLGEKIVLFRFMGGALGWWSRVFDVETPAKTPAGSATQPVLKIIKVHYGIYLARADLVINISPEGLLRSVRTDNKSYGANDTPKDREHVEIHEGKLMPKQMVELARMLDGWDIRLESGGLNLRRQKVNPDDLKMAWVEGGKEQVVFELPLDEILSVCFT